MQKRILLVDDESSLRRSISLGLSQEGYDVEPCETGLDALRKLELYKKNNMNLDTVVLDIKLPDIDGIKLGKIIRSKYPDTYLIFITGYADNYNVHEINSLNVSALMEKPFTNSELAKQILAIDKIKTAATGVVAVKEEKPVVYSAYALIKLEKDADFFETYRSLYFMNNVLYCDTTKGEYDIFMLIQSDCEEK
ncbi:MAG: response regulator [Bacteroidota bacterium]